MTRSTRMLAAAAALTTALAAPVASAQTGTANWGTFLGAAVGDTDYDTGLKLYFGQQFHPNLAWEAQYADFGERNQGPGGSIRASASAIGGSLVGLLPVTPQFTVFGKLGAHYTRQKFSGPGSPRSDSEFEVGIGAGLGFQLMPQLMLRLEVENIGDPGDFISIGAQFRF